MSVDRFATSLYGIREAAGYLSVPPSTLTTWAYGCEHRRAGAGDFKAKPIITAARPERPEDAAVPFIGLAEAYALAAFRSAWGSHAADPAGHRCFGTGVGARAGAGQ